MGATAHRAEPGPGRRRRVVTPPPCGASWWRSPRDAPPPSIPTRLPACQGASRVPTTVDAGVAHGAPPAAGDGSVTSDALLRGAKVVRILHNGESYQLRATRHGKLILTK